MAKMMTCFTDLKLAASTMAPEESLTTSTNRLDGFLVTKVLANLINPVTDLELQRRSIETVFSWPICDAHRGTLTGIIEPYLQSLAANGNDEFDFCADSKPSPVTIEPMNITVENIVDFIDSGSLPLAKKAFIQVIQQLQSEARWDKVKDSVRSVGQLAVAPFTQPLTLATWGFVLVTFPLWRAVDIKGMWRGDWRDIWPDDQKAPFEKFDETKETEALNSLSQIAMGLDSVESVKDFKEKILGQFGFPDDKTVLMEYVRIGFLSLLANKLLSIHYLTFCAKHQQTPDLEKYLSLQQPHLQESLKNSRDQCVALNRKQYELLAYAHKQRLLGDARSKDCQTKEKQDAVVFNKC